MVNNPRVSGPSDQGKEIKRLVTALRRVVGEHNAPADCYSTGPVHGDARDGVCPSCEALRILEEYR